MQDLEVKDILERAIDGQYRSPHWTWFAKKC